MALQIITGGSGTGKTRLMYEKLIEKSESENFKNAHFLVIVPEQFTLETQKTIVELSKAHGTMNIDILSFKRLAKRLFDEAGVNVHAVLDDTGKCLILRKVIEENKQSLSVFGSKTRMASFIDEMKSMISELYQYGINDEKLEQMIEKSGKKPLLRAKLQDIKIVADKFKEYLQDRFIVNEELLTRVCQLIPKSQIVKNSYITLDEYTGFSPIQYDVIRELLKYACEVTVTSTVREAGNVDFSKGYETDIFNLSKKTINKIKRIALEENVEIYQDIILEELVRLKGNKTLSYLEQNIFKYGVKEFDNPKEENEQISIHVCDNLKNEAEFVSYKINQLVRENNYRFKDIAVVTADINSYYHCITESFFKYKIPCFIDFSRSLSSNPMVETIRALFEIVEENYSYESVFGYLRSGMSSLTREETDILENYVIGHGIRGIKKWSKEIEGDARNEELEKQGNKGKQKVIDNEIDKCNVAREKLLADTKELYELYKGKSLATVNQAIQVLRNIINRLNIEAKMEIITNNFYDSGDISRGREFGQTYEIIMELFEKLENIIGDEAVSAREFSAMLDSGFAEIKVGVVPPTLDRVVVGDIERTRLNNVKVLFLIGANDGMIPKASGNAGVLTRSEREFLAEAGIELSPTVRENSFIQKFYLYLMLTKMSERLFISFHRTGSDGRGQRPSYIINHIIKMFKNVEIIDESVDESNECSTLSKKITNMDLAVSYISENIHDYILGKLSERESKKFKEIYVKCINSGLDMKPLTQAAVFSAEKSVIDEAVARAMYGNELKNSISRLETFASCAYRHFISYGLSLMERKEYSIEQNDIGNIYHRAIELFFTKIRDRNISYKKIDDELRKLIISESVDEAAGEEKGKVFADSGRNAYMLEKIKRIADKTAWILQKQIASGSFEPKMFEWRFSDENGLDKIKYHFDGGVNMGLRGIVDRVDFYNTGDDIYVKIVDYKSGSKKFEINDVYNGLQLQLVMYMEAVLEDTKKKNPDKNVIPAGIFYYNIDDPVLKSEEIKFTDDSEVNKKILENAVLIKQRPDGLFADNEEVLNAMDENINEIRERGGESLVFPAGFKKSGEYLKNCGNAALSSIASLIDFVHDKTGQLGEEMLKGKIEVNPYIKAGSQGASACDYCPYGSICGFDKSVRGYNQRVIGKVDKEEIWNKIIN